MLCAVCCTVYGVRVMGYLIIVSGALAVIQLNLLRCASGRQHRRRISQKYMK